MAGNQAHIAGIETIGMITNREKHAFWNSPIENKRCERLALQGLSLCMANVFFVAEVGFAVEFEVLPRGAPYLLDEGQYPRLRFWHVLVEDDVHACLYCPRLFLVLNSPKNPLAEGIGQSDLDMLAQVPGDKAASHNDQGVFKEQRQ